MARPPARYRAYNLCHQRVEDEVPWLRLADLKEAEPLLPRPIVLCNGAFDLLHLGHMRLLFAAHNHGATVIVGLDSNRKVKALKGEGRPVQSWQRRATTLNYMPVDAVVEIDTDEDFKTLVRTIKPDLRVLSSEYLGHRSRIRSVPVLYVQDRGDHTSDLISRLGGLA